ncbi:MAG: hypothetical protein ACI84K_000103 [Pseudohongiellaceae bacterium]|jgi:hypothetical protein
MTLRKLDHANQLTAQFKRFYENLNHDNYGSDLIDQLYHQDMTFKDSFHGINGLDDFKLYCGSLYENLSACDFVFHKSWVTESDAMLTWTMTFSHPRLRGGRSISVEGASEISFDEKVYFHQDYFDGGNLLYEHVPVLGSVISYLKKRMNT